MRSNICTAIFLSLLGVAAISAQTPVQNQTQPAAGGSTDGMDMSKPAGNSNTNDTNSAKPMDMSHGDSMKMCDCKMDMGKGSDAGKPMDMSSCMAMMSGGKGDLAKIPPGTLRVAVGDKSNDWTQSTLAALPHVTVTVHNEHTKADDSYSGVPLIALLTPLGVTDKPHGKDLRLYVVAVGSDGYEAVYSIGEATPDVGASTIIVADSENGKPLSADGPLKLIGTGDKRPARWVRNLVAINVQSAG